MSLYKRKGSPCWWVRFTHNGRRIQQSTGTADRAKAQQYHDRLKASLWEQDRLGVKPGRSWNDAVVKWLEETRHKATHADDVARLRWLDKFLRGQPLDRISRDVIGQIGEIKARESSGPTANRTLALIRAILRRACHEWEWIEKAPKVRMFKERKRRVRWITRVEAERLLSFLPAHQADMARFALSTGLRQANVTGLEWSQLDMQRRVAWIHPDQAKARKAIPVPLNDEAVEVIRRQLGKHSARVFTFKGKPVRAVNTKAWTRALRLAGIEDFRWHDLRHTWASWHVQAGTSIQELQELGGWESVEMVRRYAHLAPENLAKAAARIIPIGTKMATAEERKRVSGS
jgi:integrase